MDKLANARMRDAKAVCLSTQSPPNVRAATMTPPKVANCQSEVPGCVVKRHALLDVRKSCVALTLSTTRVYLHQGLFMFACVFFCRTWYGMRYLASLRVNI